MPLRRWFSAHGLPGWYSWVVVVVLSITTSGLSLAISINAQHRQQEQGRQASCAVIVAQDNAFSEATPATNAGRRAAMAWHSLREQLHCG